MAMADPTGDSPHNTGPLYEEKEVNDHTGLEVDHTQEGLRTVLHPAGLEAVPAEHQKDAIPQTNYEGPEKEAWDYADKETVSQDKPEEPRKQSILKRRWKLWASLAALLVVIVVVAVAVPLSVRHVKSR